MGVAFVTIAVAELADKTQLVTISQACRYPYPPVLAGSALALVAVTAVGVLIGAVFNRALPSDLISAVAGALFLVFGALLLREWYVDRRRREGGTECEAEDPAAGAECEVGSWAIFRSTFAMVALAELGDKTQLGVIALAGKYDSAWAIFVGAGIALVLVSTAGVIAGRMVAQRFSAAAMQLLAGVLFIILGALFLLSPVLDL